MINNIRSKDGFFPEKAEFTLFIHARQAPYDSSAFISCHDSSWDDMEDYTLIGTTTVTIDIPQVNINGHQVSNLKKKKEDLIAETTKKITLIDEKINSLLAIEHTSETES